VIIVASYTKLNSPIQKKKREIREEKEGVKKEDGLPRH